MTVMMESSLKHLPGPSETLSDDNAIAIEGQHVEEGVKLVGDALLVQHDPASSAPTLVSHRGKGW